MDIFDWDVQTSHEYKWGFDGMPFGSEIERDRVLMGLLYS